MPTTNSSPISSPHVSQGLAEPGVVAVSGVSDHGRARNSLGDGLPDLFGGDERFGAEHDIIWHTGSGTPALRRRSGSSLQSSGR